MSIFWAVIGIALLIGAIVHLRRYRRNRNYKMRQQEILSKYKIPDVFH